MPALQSGFVFGRTLRLQMEHIQRGEDRHAKPGCIFAALGKMFDGIGVRDHESVNIRSDEK